MSDARGQELSSEYRLRFEGLAAYRQAVWQVLCRQYFSRLVSADAAVLDLGCGWGEFSNNIEARERWAMDLNPDAQKNLDSAVKFLEQDCAEPWPLDAGSLDVVFSSNFLEHLKDKAAIERTLEEAVRCLKPGGRVILLGPNIKYVPGAYWDFWDHFVPLTEQSVAEVLRLKGLSVSRIIDRFLPYSMSDGNTPPLFLIRWYLRLPLAWRFLGKQFLVVAEKPGAP